jgi:hypothetical protein
MVPLRFKLFDGIQDQISLDCYATDFDEEEEYHSQSLGVYVEDSDRGFTLRAT